MRRRTLILLSMLFLYSCAVTRKDRIPVADNTQKTFTISDLKRENITATDFQIQKASIKVNNEGKEDKFLLNLKFKAPGTYLLSIKSFSGIEAARIFITKDTLLINDRIKRKVFCGSPKTLEEKYGISFKMIPVILGDFIEEYNKNDEETICRDNKNTIKIKIEDKTLVYTVNCKYRKIESTSVYRKNEKEGVNIIVTSFFRQENFTIPENIEVKETSGTTSMVMRIEKFSRNEITEVDFYPGRNYEKVILK